VPFTSLQTAPVVAIGFGIIPPIKKQRFSVATDFSFTWPKYDGSGSDDIVGDYNYTNRVFVLKTGLNFVFRFAKLDRRFSPYIAAGPIFQYLRTVQTTSLSKYSNSQQSLKFGAEGILGASYRLGIGSVVLDIRYAVTKLTHRLTGDTNTGGLGVCVGYQFIF